MSKNYVFTYGTLKQGFGNHRLLETSKYISTTTTTEKYFMGSYSAFPIVIENNADYNIVGEVYEVSDDTMYQLDLLEGNGTLYQRKTVRVKDFDKLVWIYFIKNPDDFSEDGVMTSDTHEIQEWIGNKRFTSFTEDVDVVDGTLDYIFDDSSVDDIINADGVIRIDG